jgi:uncharacterized protein YjiK
MTLQRLIKCLGLLAVAASAAGADKDFLFYQYDATGKPKLRTVTPAVNQLLRFNATKDLVPWSLVVLAENMGAGSVLSAAIMDGTVTSSDILDGTVATADLANAGVTADKMAAGTLTGGFVLEGRLPDLASYHEIMRQDLNTEGRFTPVSAGYLGASYGSGVAWHPSRQRLYVIDNDGPGLVELSATGRYLRTITLSGFSDVEAICWMGPSKGAGAAIGTQFALAEEVVTTGGVARGAVIVCQIPASGSVTITKGSGANWVQTVNPQWTAVQTNLGLEALGVDFSGDLFFAATEKAEVDGDWKIYSFNNVSGDQAVTAEVSLTTLLSGVATDVSDLKIMQRATSGEYSALILSHEGTTGSTGPGKLINAGPNTMIGPVGSASWLIHSQLTLPAAFTLCEGVDVSPDGRTIFVTSEKGAGNMAKLLILQAP